MREGSGPACDPGDAVQIQYSIWLDRLDGEEMLDTTAERGPTWVAVDTAQAYPGFHAILRGIQAGEVRRATVPWYLTRGGERQDWSTDERRPLYFHVEALELRKAGALEIETVTPGTDKRAAAADDWLHISSRVWTDAFEGATELGDPDSAPPEAVRLGWAHVVQGWEQGLLGMVPGETRRLHIPWNCAGGTLGIPGLLGPPLEDLFVEVSLLEIGTPGQLDHAVLQPGEGEPARDGDLAVIEFDMWPSAEAMAEGEPELTSRGLLSSGYLDLPWEQAYGYHRYVRVGGDGDMSAFTQGLRGMRVGEIRQITAPWNHAFGPDGFTARGYPWFGTSVIKVELVRLIPADASRSPSPEEPGAPPELDQPDSASLAAWGQQPTAEQTVEMIWALARNGALDGGVMNATPHWQGLLAAHFRRHGERLPAWTPGLATLPPLARYAVAEALWLADTDEARRALRRVVSSLPQEQRSYGTSSYQSPLPMLPPPPNITRDLERLLLVGPPDLTSWKLHSGESFDVLFGFYQVTRDQALIRQLATGFELSQFKAGTIQWVAAKVLEQALGQTASSDAEARRTLEQVQLQAEGPVREALDRILE